MVTVNLARVVRKVDNAIHRINRFPVDSVIKPLTNWGLRVGKHLQIDSRHTYLDILTRAFGYLFTLVWISSLPVIKGRPRDPNKATQLVNYFMNY